MRKIYIILFLTMVVSGLKAQITIGGNVYGGGNAGVTDGSTSVTVRSGDINAVFGGARMADVNGSAFVNIDGANASDNIIITSVYGGNDIAGTIGTSSTVPELSHRTENSIDNSFNVFIRTSATPAGKSLLIGSLFGGGNGDYDYTLDSYKDIKTKPEINKTYLEIMGGCIAHLYGGGNNATVKENTTICLDNGSPLLTQTNVWPENPTTAEGQAQLAALAKRMGMSTYQSNLSSYAFNFARVFGGNNKAEMAIRPKWNLLKGTIRDLYSGGNQGAMTYEKGIFLPIKSDGMKIENVFGGCRMADVNPKKYAIPAETIEGVAIPAGYSARVVIDAGEINNVYGGNDISGNVYGGNAVGIHSSIKGNVYGGGNGSYAYTDNPELGKLEKYQDFYYTVPAGKSSVEALNAFRPNAESVSIRVIGKKNETTGKITNTIIGGAIYCGGNSATLHNDDPNKDAAAELKIGSYVIADKVFLGNNGENMKSESILKQYAGTITENGKDYDFSQMNLASDTKDAKGQTEFDKYMDGVTMDVMPRVVFDDVYEPYSTLFGSFYCGGNVGSLRRDGAITVNFNDKVVVYDKVVGGSNEANIYKSAYNPEYLGGLLGDPDTNGNKLILNFNGLKIRPMRWRTTTNDQGEKLRYISPVTGQPELEWNTISASTGQEVDPVIEAKVFDKATDLDRRFKGGNIYGGCYSSGHINGNVVINLNATLVDRKGEKAIFDQIEEEEGEAKLYGHDNFKILDRKSGVLLDKQGMDVLGKALNVFGGGYGGDSEIWGGVTINLNKGYTFQIFGGGEKGSIGKADGYNETTKQLEYTYNPKYSTCINLNGNSPGTYRGDTDNKDGVVDNDDMAEAEFIYGGAFEGLIVGDTRINLGNGRIFNSFAGSCNADIIGHTETYVGLNSSSDSDLGFPWVRDHIYGGNDLGGKILQLKNFKSRVSSAALPKVHNPQKQDDPDVLFASAYTEYIQGRVENIFGGCYGDYDYKDRYFEAYTNDDGTPKEGFSKPYFDNAFINFKPNSNQRNTVAKILGAGQGMAGERDGDKSQDRSYVLVDVPANIDNFANTEIFGSGAYDGLGMRWTKEQTFAAGFDLDKASAVIDLLHGRVGAAYGGSFNEGVTRRTVVNVPEQSTINIKNIFGGAYGSEILPPCDVYESNVNYRNTSENARVTGAIYGGNNSERRTLYAHVNISSPVWSNKNSGYLASVYGAGKGADTWSEYTEVNLNDGARVYEVYGGGELGHVLNSESVMKYMNLYKEQPSPDIAQREPWNDTERWVGGIVGGTLKNEYKDRWKADWKAAWTFGDYYASQGEYTRYASNKDINLANDKQVRIAEMDNRDLSSLTDEQKARTYKRYNTNVLIHKGATVVGYAYGGGLGEDKTPLSGDTYGTTYIALLGGTVMKDLYAAGTTGAVYNLFGAENFTASANAFVAGGTARNVYGGGWKGDVGYTTMAISDDGKTATFDNANEKPGETHVVIGIRPDQASVPTDYGFYNGVPAIQRNAYSGGEGGAVLGNANLILNNGYIGYEYKDGQYVEKLDDETYYANNVYAGEGRLEDCGNVFGGGYDVASSVDTTNVVMWGGVVRNSMHGGGEIATIGRGAIDASGEANSVRTLKGFYKAGKAKVTMYNGRVQRNVFGGGKGYNLLGYGQGMGTLYTDGYVFGQTEVDIFGGEIGNDKNLAQGYGNVFGGGDIGYVYSPSVLSDKTKEKHGTGSPGHIYYYDEKGNLTEDCKVVIAPKLQVKNLSGTTINGHHYNLYDYVDTEDLNYLPKKDANGTWVGGWEDLLTEDVDGEKGIIIHNAVFGGGNVSSNSDKTYANATTVYGNTTATLSDVYHRDFISVGTEHTGGLYGGGNLSMVDGYRELNITNYGTDYYGLDARIDLETYRNLSNRERAYFQLEYVCTGSSETKNNKQGITIGGEFYENGQHLSEEKYLKLIEAYPSAKTYWEPFGFCSIYAGRLLNTIQRADLCGVFGSRMVLQGAKDRVADIGENIDYTINRVGELSLNQRRSRIASDIGDDALHGNYFGIYSLVNCLGNLTSDVHFSDPYIRGDGEEDKSQSFFKYKGDNYTKNNRNNGKSFNQVALASGVFLELTTENSTAAKKEYGLVSGVIELDLINVKQDQVGGGFVYAKNEHRVPRCYPDMKNVILSPFNRQAGDEAVTYKRMRYSADDQSQEWSSAESTAYNVGREIATQYSIVPYQTSGNFIHPTKRIIDDCYPVNNAYDIGSTNYSEAHYWYVKGDVYIYDQKVSAYTGSATAYSKVVHLPLTITAASHGKLQLLNVKPNLYAYYANTERTARIGDLDADGKAIEKVSVNNESEAYQKNEVITWWDWNNLSYAEKRYFVEMTYVNCVSVNVDGKDYAPGEYVMDDKDFTTFKSNSHVIKNAEGEVVNDVDEVFRTSNNIGHDSGYLLTFDMNSPAVWDDYYTATNNSGNKITKAQYEELLDAAKTDEAKQQVIDSWRIGPTFTPKESGVYGQRHYEVGEIITEDIYNNNMVGAGDQAVVEKAYVATQQVSYTYGGQSKTINVGTAIPEKEYKALDATTQKAFGTAWICTNTVKLDNGIYLLNGDMKTKEEIDAMKTTYPLVVNEINAALSPAYICSKEGAYGGQRFEAGTNYNAIKAWCSLPEEDRYDANGTPKFNYNYDALDLLTDAAYLKVSDNNDRTTEQAYHAPYSDQVNVEYQAVFHATSGKSSITYAGGTLNDGDAISNEVFESQIRNDQRHYTRVTVPGGGDKAYIANKNFIYGGTPFGVGQVVDADVYNNNQNDVDVVNFSNAGTDPVIKYYCYEAYDNVAKGTTITDTEYAGLTNDQKYFVIQGREPTETTTLYVSRQSDIYDVSKERVYTVVYQYTYYEDEDDGSMKLTNELHVINVHLQLESGVPQIGTLAPPATVLPGTAIGLKAPEVTPGTYEVLTSGWELFTNIDEADHHRNGIPFDNGNTPVYWYQNGKNYVSFYSKTYLGKTYSNPVPLSVANYHDMDAVMADKEHHYCVDKTTVDRPCKIYLDDRSKVEGKSDLDLLKDFFDLSMINGTAPDGGDLAGHALLDNHVQAGRNLEFFLKGNVAPTKYTNWTPIASNEGECFSGNLHGDGYTVSGLSKSLFGSLCGNVYNLGVTGSFTSAGVADTGDGYVENCWVKSSATQMDADVQAVFGKPSASSGTQLVNSYYSESNPYSVTSNPRGSARQMTEKAFYDGTVAYNLNGFYLNKRYYDNNTSWTGSKKQYKYLKQQADGTLTEEPLQGSYPDSYAIYPLTGTKQYGYVEDRYADGDFRYAGGSIPGSADVRTRTMTEGTGADEKVTYYYSPIWPDDYIYFGQTLTYGYDANYPHVDLPSHATKTDGRLPGDMSNNRVYRAPAYFGNSTKSVAHFNPSAILAAYSKPKSVTDTDLKTAYPGMTAIDFAGHNDVANGYKQGLDGNIFYAPLLDDDGLVSISNAGQTTNLVVYEPSAEANEKTYTVLNNYFVDPVYRDYGEEGEYYNDGKNYNRVHVAPTDAVVGHLVQSDLTTADDHLLVDKQEFNAPIAYRMGDGLRMWYQRRPENYAGQYTDEEGLLVYDAATGWDAVSLPFTTEVVTTHQKGEISHFYQGSTRGHEYWLRRFAGNVKPKEGADGVYTADFYGLDAVATDKEYFNTFLWDYYYSQEKDKNEDEYLDYYRDSHTMKGYPYATAGTPYLVGFPGNLYYEFDLSGQFQPENTFKQIPQLEAQTITFASTEGAQIGKTDDEVKPYTVTNCDYQFMPNYKNGTLTAGKGYVLNGNGSSFDVAQEGTQVVPFRPYIMVKANQAQKRAPKSIVFNNANSSFGGDPKQAGTDGMYIHANDRKVIVTSNLKHTADVRIFNVSGLCVANFTVEPGQTIETPFYVDGVYVVHAANGRYRTKLVVK